MSSDFQFFKNELDRSFGPKCVGTEHHKKPEN